MNKLPQKERWGGSEEGLRLEVESGVIKIHPTVQTKGGMKKEENAGGKRVLGLRKIWVEKKIVSLSRSLNSTPLLKGQPFTRCTVILRDNRKQAREGEGRKLRGGEDG